MSNTTSYKQFITKELLRQEEKLNLLLLDETSTKRTKPAVRRSTADDYKVFGTTGNSYRSRSNIKVSQSGRYLRVKVFDHLIEERTLKRTKTKVNRSNTQLKHETSLEWYERKQERNRHLSDNRAKDRYIDKSRANYKQSVSKTDIGTRSIRISFATLPKDRNQMYRWLDESKQNFKKQFGYPMSYQVVDEYGSTNGRLHQHIIINNAPRLSNEQWHELIFKRGYVKADTCYSPNVAVYNAKYFSKDFSKKGRNIRRYSTSKGLIPSVDIKGIYNQHALLKDYVSKGYYIKEVTGYNPYTKELINWQIWIPPDEWDIYKNTPNKESVLASP